jgi:hypothetical protein
MALPIKINFFMTCPSIVGSWSRQLWANSGQKRDQFPEHLPRILLQKPLQQSLSLVQV